MNSNQIKTKQTFEHIRKQCKEEEYYKTRTEEWDQIQHLISKTPTNYQCSGCDTYWTKVYMVNDHERICPMCDTHSHPFLCNPLNTKYVLEYIDPKFYKYIFKIYQEYEQVADEDPYEIFKKACTDNQIIDQYIALKVKNEYGTSVDLYSTIGELYLEIFIVNGESNYNTNENFYPFYISEFSFYISELGLNRRKYNYETDQVKEKQMKYVNQKIQEDQVYPKLLEFINSNEVFTVIPGSEFKGFMISME